MPQIQKLLGSTSREDQHQLTLLLQYHSRKLLQAAQFFIEQGVGAADIACQQAQLQLASNFCKGIEGILTLTKASLHAPTTAKQELEPRIALLEAYQQELQAIYDVWRPLMTTGGTPNS